MRRVQVIGRGLVCGFGAGEEALWAGLLAGRCCIEPCPELLPPLGAGAPPRAARVPEALLPATAPARTLLLLRLAAAQLQASPGWPDRRGRLGICLGTTQGEVRGWEAGQAALEEDPSSRPAAPLLAAPVRALAEELGADGPASTISMACASGTAAVGMAASWIRRGLCELAVAGGADALSSMVQIGFQTLRALDPERPRPFDARRAGLGIGEGAGLLLLAGVEELPAGGIEVLGCGVSSDAHHLTGPDPEGRGLARAIRAALLEAELPPGRVQAVNAHGTATVFNDLMEAKALSSVFGPQLEALPVNSIKGAIGHCMAAAGAIEAVLCAGSLERGLFPATVGLEQRDPAIDLDVVQGEARAGDYNCVLSTSSGFGGINAALLLGRSP